MPIDQATLQPLTSQAILALVAALGLSSTAGLRAVATLFAIGVVSDVSFASGGPEFHFAGVGATGAPLLQLTGPFKVLGDWRVLLALGILTIVEVIVDKFPVLDNVNDIIHTVIRPVVGGVIVAGTANSLSDANVWVAAVVGAALAFGVHATKTTARATTTATTAGVANPVLSVGEDVIALLAIFMVVVGKALAITISPWIGFALLIIVIIAALALVFAAWRITLAAVRFVRGGSSGRQAAQAAGGGH